MPGNIEQVGAPKAQSDEMLNDEQRIESIDRFNWEQIILNRTLTRRDGHKVLLSPHGNEAEIYSLLNEESLWLKVAPEFGQYWNELKEKQIVGKNCLVVPAYSTNAFSFREFGAGNTLGIDNDPNTVIWLDTIRKYFNYKEIGRKFLACADWGYENRENIAIQQQIRQEGYDIQNIELFLADQLKAAIEGSEIVENPTNLEFRQAFLGVERERKDSIVNVLADLSGTFDFVYVPYLLNINNGIVDSAAIKNSYDDLWELCSTNAVVMVHPYTGDPDMPQLANRVEILDELLPKNKFKAEELMPGGAQAGFLRALK